MAIHHPPVNSASSATVADLCPTEKLRVYDLVSAAGIDVSDWANFRGRVPSSNPKYCYDWVFVGSDRIAICLWHREMRQIDSLIFQDLNYRFLSETSPKPWWRRRGARMDSAFRQAWEHKWAVRVIVVDGFRNANAEETSSVNQRLLDPVPWFVSSYDYQNGDCRIIRGKAPPRIIDQFILQAERPPDRRKVTSFTIPRDSRVRANVLLRSKEQCESCGEPGFLMQDGRRYLETHHIIPLSLGGPDIEANMIAICPNEHREAHHGLRAGELGQKFTAIVTAKHHF